MDKKYPWYIITEIDSNFDIILIKAKRLIKLAKQYVSTYKILFS